MSEKGDRQINWEVQGTVPNPPVRHNHDAIGVYGNCPGCGTVLPTPVPDVREAVAAALAKHQWQHTRETHCACGFRTPLAQLAVAGYIDHVADAVLAIPAIATALGLTDE